MSDFLESVTTAFQPMIEGRLLSVIWTAQDDSSFGNASVVLGGRAFRLQVLRDRGDTWVDAASEVAPNEWFPLERVLLAIGALNKPEGLVTPIEAAQLVTSYWAELESGLSTERFTWTRAKLAQLEGVRHEEALERLARRRNLTSVRLRRLY